MKLLHTVSECYTAEKRVHNSHLESGMESKVIILRVLVIIAIFNASSLGATDFCIQPLGMKRKIILDGQITESTFYKRWRYRKGFNARLDNNHCWCSLTGSTLSQQWVRVDLNYPMSIRGITIQGDRGWPPNYIKKFKLRYSTNGTNFLYKTADGSGLPEEFVGANGQHQTIDRMFNRTPFLARYVEFRPTQFAGDDACVRFELYGCAYVCNQGLGIEVGGSLPSGILMTSPSNKNGKVASSARLNSASSCWCASTKEGNQYLQVDFGKEVPLTGMAIQGNPTANSWVKDFYFDYGRSLHSLATYQEYGTNKLFVGNDDRSTIVVNWFKVRLAARYVRIKPKSWIGDICMRVEIIGCNSEPTAPMGFSASPSSATSIQLAWNQPELLNGILHDYRIRYKLSSDSNFGTSISAHKQLTYNVVGLTPFTEYEIQVQATTNGGNNIGPWTSPISRKTLEGVPTHPLSLSANALSSTSIQLKWSQPSTLNGKLYGYKVRYKSFFDSNFGTPISVGKQLTFNIIHLKPFTDYQLQVQATTHGGVNKGPWSSSISIKTLEGVPTAPLNLSANASSATSIQLAWNQPLSLNGALHDYRIRYKLSSDSNFGAPISAGKQLRYDMIGLNPFTSYELQVQATTKGGFILGPWSSSVPSTTRQGVPTVPMRLSANPSSATSIQLTWSQPAELNGILHNYRIRYKLSSDLNFGAPISAGKQSAYNVTGLTPFTNYELQVQATTNFGTNKGQWSISTSIKTLEGASTAPLNVSATTISATSIRLTWNQPTSFNGILYAYQIKYRLSPGATYSNPFVICKQLNYIITNLKPYANYEVKVRASTKGGIIPGTWSSSAKFRTLEGLPSQPQSLTVLETKSENVLIRWAKPMIENGVVRNYTIKFTGSKTYNVSFTQRGDMTVQNNASTESTSSVVRNLVPGTDYRIKVAATTEAGMGNFSSVITVATPNAAPPKPTIQDQGVSKSVRKLLLGDSSNINGPISKYQLFIVEGQAQSCLHSGLNEAIAPSKVPLIIEVETGVKAIKGLSLEMGTFGSFSLCYYAVAQEKNQSLVSEATTIAIERKHLPKIDPSPYNSSIGESSFVIPLTPGPSATKSYHVIVMEGKASVKSSQEWLPNELDPYDAATYKTGKPYVAAVLLSYLPSFSVGDGKEYVSSNRGRRNIGSVTYKNVPLKAGTDYLVFQRAYISKNVYYSTPWIGPLKTKQAGLIAGPDPLPVGLIVGVLVAVVIILALSIFVFFICRRRKTTGKDAESYEKPMMMSPIAQSSENESYNDDEDEGTNSESSQVPSATTHSILELRKSSNPSLTHVKVPRLIGHDSRHPAISLEDFARRSKDLQKDSHHEITQEYNDLEQGQQYTWDIAVNADNKKKNRYANIAAYDHSRVKLIPIRGVPHSDYFNANYISGYEKDAVYIASQGPIDSVLGDFWRMIWDANVSAIVMLTNLVERGKKKCSQYWPDIGSVEFDEVTVNYISVDSYVDYTIRCFSITRIGFEESRTVYQFHYTTWPDHGIPESPTDLLNLQRILRRTFPFTLDSPIVVHCSAGVGRTGTFIVIDAMLHLLRSQRKIDVFNYLNFIRTQRIHMVQVEEQYLFIYKTLLESVTCGMTEIDAQNLRIKVNQLSSKGKSNQTGFDKQFQRLMVVTPHFNEKETATAFSGGNLPRNRKSSIVPREIHRVILQQLIYENDRSTDYINALFVNGYKRKNAFIATQHPLPNTINDFWAMIYQTNVVTFVLLNKAQSGKENLPVFWPEVEQETVFGSIVVRSEQEQMTVGTVERDFVVSHRDSRSHGRYVKMFQFINWPDRSVPKECGKLLALINKVEKCQRQQSEDQPIVVMCSDGAGRTGTFIAINIILERFKTEQLIDVFQTIKKIRAFRPEFVENALQYKFCHSIVQEYMESFDAYSNFNG